MELQIIPEINFFPVIFIIFLHHVNIFFTVYSQQAIPLIYTISLANIDDLLVVSYDNCLLQPYPQKSYHCSLQWNCHLPNFQHLLLVFLHLHDEAVSAATLVTRAQYWDGNCTPAWGNLRKSNHFGGKTAKKKTGINKRVEPAKFKQHKVCQPTGLPQTYISAKT